MLTLLLIIAVLAVFGWAIVRTRGAVRWLIAFAGLIVLMPMAMIATLVYTEAGLKFVAGQLYRLERFDVHIEGVSGTLAGPLYVDRFELDKPRVHIVSHDIVVYPRLRQLFIQTVGIRALTARNTVVEILRAPPSPPPTRPLRFMPSFMRIDIENAVFTGLRYVNIDGRTVDATAASGAATLTSQHIRAPRFRAHGEWFDLSGDLLLGAQRPLAIELSTRARIDYRDINYVIEGNLGGTIDELAIKASALEPTVASADAILTRPNDSWRIAGKVSSPEFSLSPWLERPPFSLRAVALDVEADPNGIHAQGKLVVPQLDAQALAINARGRFAERTIHIERADLALQNAPVKLRVAGSVEVGPEPTIDARAEWTQLQWPLRGDPLVSSPSGSGSLQGTLPYAFSIAGEFAARNVPPAAGSASGLIAKTSVTLHAFDVNALNGRLTGAGTLAFEQPRRWDVRASVTDIDTAPLDARFPGRITATFIANGVGTDKNARFAASIAELRGQLRNQPVNARGSVQRDAKGWRVSDARVDYGNAKLVLDGELHDEIHATWSLQAASLEPLLPNATGSLAFAGSAHGPLKAARVVVDARGERIGYSGWRAQQLTVSGDVDLSGNEQSRLSVRANQVGASASLIETFNATGSGTAGDHRIVLEAVGSVANPREPASRADVTIQGRYVEGAWNASIQSTEIKAGAEEERLALVEPGKLVVNRERASLDPLCFAMGNGRLCAEGKWEREGPWEGVVSGYELPLAAFLPPGGPDTRYSGRIEGRVRAFGAPNSLWQGDAGMRIVDAAIIYQPLGAEPETLNLGTGGLAATATPERVNFSFGVQAFTDTFLFANANIDRRTAAGLTTAPLVGDFRARAADANILPIVFPEIDHAAGLLTADGKVRGTLQQPQIDGRIELSNGEFDSYRVNLGLRALNLTANLSGNALDFSGKGRAGEGELNLGGQFEWNDGVSRGNLQIRGENLLVADLPDYRVVASPDLTFAIDGRQINATGTVAIPSALVQPADLGGAVQTSDDARYVGEHPAESAGRYVVNSDIRVTMGEDVRVDSFGLQGRIVGGVATSVKTGETPVGRGELSVAEGRYEAYGQKLEISRGKLLFEASPLSDPGLDIEARRKIETIVVGLNVRGTLQQPRLSFFSEPSMPQTQIVSYLLVGKPVDRMQAGDSATMSSARDALAMQGGGLLASQIGRRIGLEEVGVESTINSSGETNQQLVLGKFLSPRLFVSYGISLTESINTLKMRYTISDRWVLKTEAGENQSADIEFTVER